MNTVLVHAVMLLHPALYTMATLCSILSLEDKRYVRVLAHGC